MIATKPSEKPGAPKEFANVLPKAHESTAAARLRLKLSAVTAATAVAIVSIRTDCHKAWQSAYSEAMLHWQAADFLRKKTPILRLPCRQKLVAMICSVVNFIKLITVTSHPSGTSPHGSADLRKAWKNGATFSCGTRRRIWCYSG